MIIKAMDQVEEWLWIKNLAECVWCEDTKGLVAWKNGKIVGAVALDSWSYNAVNIHIALEDSHIMRHGFPEAVFGYIFDTCDKGVVIGVTAASNERALRFNKRVGLEELYRVKDGYNIGVDYVIQELRKEDCKYLRICNGQESAAAA